MTEAPRPLRGTLMDLRGHAGRAHWLVTGLECRAYLSRASRRVVGSVLAVQDLSKPSEEVVVLDALAMRLCVQHGWVDVSEEEKGHLVADTWDVLDEHRYCVFFDLWNRGYYVSAGHSFAADWMVYSDHPSKCHASLTIRFLFQAPSDEEGPRAVFGGQVVHGMPSALVMQASSRVSTTAAKVPILATVRVEEGVPKVVYYSMDTR